MESKGIRIQKVLSDNGILSRRKAEEYIEAGRVTVNGHPARLGHPVNPARDIIAIDGKNQVLQRKKTNLYLMLNKPRGYVTTMSDELGRRCVADLVADVPGKVYPVGRLDRDSEGLLFLTNDGEFANSIMHPRNHVGKTYRVTVRPHVTEDQLIELSTGVEIDDVMTEPAQVHVLDKEQGRTVLQITIFEGRNRQVRKMCEAVGLEVARLRRSSIGPVKLGMLQPGEWREMTPLELSSIRGAVQKSMGPEIPEDQWKPKRVRSSGRGGKPAGRSGDYTDKSGRSGAPAGKSNGRTGDYAGKSGGRAGAPAGKPNGRTGDYAGKPGGRTGDYAGKSAGRSGTSTGKSNGHTGSYAGKSGGRAPEAGGGKPSSRKPR